MAIKLQPFLISEFSTGISTYLEPWIRPRDAFEPLINAYTYRGTINKRNGYIPFGDQLADHNPVMGIMNRINESDGTITLIVVTTRNAYLFASGTFNPALTAVGGSASIFWIGTATGTITTPTFWTHLTPSTISITDGTTTITDDGAGNLSSGGIFAAGGTINYTTGSVTLNFTGTTANVSLKITATLVGGYFTGNNTNFFNWVSWQASDTAASYLYMTNNVDPVTLFDGTFLSRPVFYVDSGHTKYITKTLDIAVYQNRLLFLRPTQLSASNADNQSIAWSAQFNPFNFVNDVGKAGGFTNAPTGDIIQSQEALRNTLIVFFSNSTWNFRFTGSDSDPFRWDRLTISKNVSAPYGSIAYDERCTALGNLGLIACDGVNVQRYDNSIVDYYETNISTQYFAQTFGFRYDNLSQGWMLYVSNGTINPVVGGGAPGSDSALIYNFLEQSWATYTFSVPMMCLGKFYAIGGARWEDLVQRWTATTTSWRSYSEQKLSPILLAGDVNGNVYWMDNEFSVTDNGTPIIAEITTTRWNPVLQIGQKTQFPYIDIYYSAVSTSISSPIELVLSFYTDNSENESLVSTLTLDGPPNSGFAFKRVYLNLIGEFIKMDIDPDEAASFQILGFIIWARPAGRMTP